MANKFNGKVFVPITTEQFLLELGFEKIDCCSDDDDEE